MKWIFLTAGLLLNSHLQASDNTQRFGGLFGTGSITTDFPSEEDDLIWQTGVFHEYEFSPNLSLNNQLISGEGDFCLITCFINDVRKVEFYVLRSSIKASHPFTARWHLFGQAGLHWYDYEFSGRDWLENTTPPPLSNSGIKPNVSAGVEFRANNGFKLIFEYQYVPMDNIDAQTMNVAVGFAF